MKSDIHRTITYILESGDITAPGHVGGVNSIKQDPQTGVLFSAGRDGSVRAWSSTGLLTSLPVSLGGGVVVPSEDENLAPAVGEFRHLKTAQLHTNWVNDIAVVRPSTVVSGSSDLMVRVWNAESEVMSTLGHHSDYVMGIASSSLCNWVASSGLDKTVALWDLDKATSIASYHVAGENTASLNYYNPEAKGSVYGLAAYGPMVAYGGTGADVGVVDTRSSSHSICKLIGHTDTVRSVLLNDEYLVSGSSDTTIKLWSLKMNRVVRTLDMHSSSVWSLHSSSDRLDSFYSGDRSGSIYKTILSTKCHDDPDLDKSQNEALKSKVIEAGGVVALVASENCGVNSICVIDKPVDGKSNGSRSHNRTLCSATDRGVSVYRDLDLDSVVDDTYERLHAKFASVLKESALSSARPSIEVLDSVSLSSESSDSELESEQTSSASSINNEAAVASCLVMPRDPVKSTYLIPGNTAPVAQLQGRSAVIRARLLNDRRTVVSLDDGGLVRVWNLLTATLIKEVQSRQGKHEAEDLFDHILDQYQTKETLPSWCLVAVRIGRVFVSISKDSVANCEVYRDELEGIVDVVQKSAEPSEAERHGDERVSLGKMVLRSLLAGFVEYCEEKDTDVRAEMVKESADEDTVDVAATEEEDKEAKEEHEKEEKDNISKEKEKEKPFRKFWKKKANGSGSQNTTVNTASPTNGTSNAADSTSFTTKTTASIPSDISENPVTAAELLDSIRRSYATDSSVSGITPATFNEVPLVTKLSETPVTVLVNESSASTKGNYMNLTRFYSNDRPMSASQFETLKEIIPYWAGLAVLKNEYIEKPGGKITFLVEPLTEKEPQLRNGSLRLSAHELMRVKKVMSYVVDKFETSNFELSKLEEDKNADYEVLCNDEVLPEKMTLLTVKTKIWKNSGDVLLKYRKIVK